MTPDTAHLRKVWPACIVCRGTRALQQHHVVTQAWLKRCYPGHLGLKLCGDVSNWVPLCWTCHQRHHTASRRLRTGELPDRAIAFAEGVLGAYAYDYLQRQYDDSEADPRVAAILAAWEKKHV